ncbi:MAG: hypothetical protein WC227_00280 [Patescibacteria group bacterium]
MAIVKVSNFFKKYPLLWRSLVGAFFVYLLYYFAFQYARVTAFPIGDDPATHITRIKTMSFSDICGMFYPIPLIIFKWLSIVFHGVELPRLFTVTISFYFFLAGLGVALLAKSISKSWIVGFLSALIFVTSRWTNDGIRMGLLGETWGWFAFALLLYFFVKKNIVFTIIFSIILIFSHPLSFIIYVLFFITICVLTFVESENKESRKFLLILLAIYALAGLLTYFFKNDLIEKFLLFVSGDPKGYGQRPFWLILTSDQPQRILVPFLAIIGLIASLKNWVKHEVKVGFALVIAGLFMSLNYVFGIYFLSFRFYPYFEMGLAVFAAVGIYSLAKTVILPAVARCTLIAILAFLAIAPSYSANTVLLNWQKNDPGAQAIMTGSDQKAITWVRDNIPEDKTIAAYWRYGIWIKAVGDRYNLVYDNMLFEKPALDDYLAKGNEVKYDYIYFPPEATSSPTDFKNYSIVYNDKVLILKKNDPPPAAPTRKKRK